MNLLVAIRPPAAAANRERLIGKLSPYKTDLEWLVVPAVMSGQFSLAEAQSKSSGMMAPVGVLLWASVSAEVDHRLNESAGAPTPLKPDEWRGGDILWVIDAIGEPEMVQALLKRKMGTDWKGRPVKMKARDKAGTKRVGVLASETPPALLT